MNTLADVLVQADRQKRANRGFLDAIEAGITIVHIDTELRPGEVVPDKVLPDVVESIRQVVLSRLRLFHTAHSGAEL